MGECQKFQKGPKIQKKYSSTLIFLKKYLAEPERITIEDAIEAFNCKLGGCVKIVPYTNQVIILIVNIKQCKF